LKWLLFICASILSSTAAYFSVFGLIKLFSGSFYPILVMASGLELSKIVSISYLTRNWSSISKLMKIYMIISVSILILLTSVGIYGFLVSSYQDSKKYLLENNSNIEVYQKKIDFLSVKLQSIDKNIDLLSNRSNNLSKYRENQERRIDTLYNRKSYSLAKSTEKFILNSQQEIQSINKNIENLYLEKSNINDSIVNLTYKINELNIETDNSDIGPIKYISDITGVNIDVTINYFIFIIIFVFDPMAIILFIAFNKYEKTEIKNSKSNVVGEMNSDGEFEISFMNEIVKNE